MSDEHDRDIAARVYAALIEAGMTQADLVNYMQIAPDKLSKSLRGKRRFSSLEVALIAEATGTSTDTLLGIEIRVIHDEDEWRKIIADQVRRHCTLPWPLPVGTDATVSAVADWIEHPPAWVTGHTDRSE